MSPLLIARAAAARLERYRRRQADAGELAKWLDGRRRLAGWGVGRTRYSMADAAAVRVAQGLVAGGALPQDKRTLRGEAKRAAYAQLRALREAVASDAGVSGVGGGGGRMGERERVIVRVYSPPPQTTATPSVLDAPPVLVCPDSPVAVTGPFDRPGASGTPLSAVAGEVVPKQAREAFAVGRPVDVPVGKMYRAHVPRPKRTDWRTKGAGGRFVSKVEREMLEDMAEPVVEPEATGVLDTRVALTYTEVMADEAPVVTTDGKCPECGMRLQRGWCGRCRVRYAEGAS